jgi:hypothetical protein
LIRRLMLDARTVTPFESWVFYLILWSIWVKSPSPSRIKFIKYILPFGASFEREADQFFVWNIASMGRRFPDGRGVGGPLSTYVIVTYA